MKDYYLDGLKRLVAISKTNRAPFTADAVHNHLKKPPVHVCLVCGHMWNTNMANSATEPKKCPACSSTLWNNGDIRKHKCRQCAHVWMSRLDRPQTCPRCKSKLWNKDPKRFVCVDCGHNQIQRMNSIPKKCGNCGSRELFSEQSRCICGNCGHQGRMEPKRQCPVCRSFSLIEKDPKPPSHENEHLVNPTALAILKSDITDTKKIIEIGNNTDIEATNAEIMVRYFRGEDPVSIARTMKISLNKAIMTLLPILKGEGWARV